MLIIDYSPFAFPEAFGPALAKPDKLHCSWADLVWAGVTVGRKNLRHMVRPSLYAHLETIVRSNTLYANLQAADYRPGLWGAADTHLLQSSTYKELDPSEKSAISYFIGLTCAKLFAEKLLDASWLIHADTYSSGLLSLPDQPSYPDLIGLDRGGNWLIVEAKGRTNWLNRRVVKRIKMSSARSVKIADRHPNLLVGFASYFSGQDKRLKVYLADPPATQAGSTAANYNFSPKPFLHTYYGLLLDLLKSEYGQAPRSETYRDEAYRIKAIEEVDLQLGLDERVYKLLHSDHHRVPEYVRRILSERPGGESEPDVSTTVGGDGIFVRLGESWSESHMHLAPSARNGAKDR